MMDRRLMAVVLIALARIAGAQVVDLPPGSHVRILAPTLAARRFEAMVLARMEDTLAVQVDDRPPVRIWMARIRELEVGRPSRLMGALRGAGFGVPVGMGVAYYGITQRTCDGATCTHGQFLPAVQTTALFGAIGAGLGMLVGGEKWKSLDLLPHATSRLQLNGNGMGFRFGF